MNSLVKKLNINYGFSLIKKLPHSINTVIYSLGELSVIIPFNYLYKVIFFLKNHSQGQFKLLSDMTVVDYPENNMRFECVYNLLSLKYNSRIRLKLYINEVVQVESICSLFSCANWLEREIWDFFGIYFKNHPDLRRILTDYGFQGHPFRKEFPLNGFISVRYDDINKIILCEPSELSQEYRSFNFQSPWSIS